MESFPVFQLFITHSVTVTGVTGVTGGETLIFHYCFIIMALWFRGYLEDTGCEVGIHACFDASSLH